MLRLFADKRVRIAAGAVLIVALALLLYLPGNIGADGTRIAIDAHYLEDSQTVEVHQTIAYKNTAADALTSIYLHNYPAAFAQRESAPFSKKDFTLAYPNGFSPGGSDITLLEVGGKPATYSAQDTLVEIALESPLPPGKTVRIHAAYTLSLPDSRGRFGHGPNTVNLLNAFLIPAVYDQDGWHLAPYSAIGDPFFSQVMDYEVTLTLPQDMSVAATGVTHPAKLAGESATYRIDAKNVRDFAAVLSRKFVTVETTTNGVHILSHAFDEASARQALDVAATAVAGYTVLFGEIPYPQIDVAAADFFVGGMEYPGLAVIDQSLYQSSHEEVLAYCVAHEVAHQWFYGAVGSNQVQHAWLDESLTEYATLVHFETWQGEAGLQRAYRSFVRPYLRLTAIDSMPIDRPLDQFKNAYEYSAVVYAKGATMWHALRQEMGDEAFFSALRRYYSTYKNSIAYPQDLLACFEEPHAAMIRDWLAGDAP